jgi:uncharacterized protein YcaQ
MPSLTPAALRSLAVTRSLRTATSLEEAIRRLGFVQADPIRAPARAQDLTLRHRVPGYRAGDIERAYPALPIEEDFFVNYGFLPRDVYRLMHPRSGLGRWPKPGKRKADMVLAFVRERGRVHPREVDAHFAHGSVTNYWGGSSSATTHLLDHLHYRGLLRIAGRNGGIRIYEPQSHPETRLELSERRARLDALLRVLVDKYAPLPSATLSWLANRMRIAVPQWQADVRRSLTRVKRGLRHERVDGIDWYMPEDVPPAEPDDAVRLLAPFDPIVWDRRRFDALWGWAYRFEAYTPASKRQFGYYALPVLWHDNVVGWANVSAASGRVDAKIGYARGRAPRDRGFARALEVELTRLAGFLALPGLEGRSRKRSAGP